VVTILALHAAAAWGLLQVDAVRTAVAEAAPLFVELIAPPTAERPPEPPAPPAPPQPKTPAPRAPAIAAAPRAEAPAAFVVPERPPEPAPPALPEPPVVAVAAPAPPAAPRELPASAIQYLEPPEPAYPRASRRFGESGLVVVRVFVGSDGLPKQLQVLQSSGFARLDEAALDGVRRARFKPPTENGLPSAGWARIPIPFELEN
jgi:protein TonB